MRTGKNLQVYLGEVDQKKLDIIGGEQVGTETTRGVKSPAIRFLIAFYWKKTNRKEIV